MSPLDGATASMVEGTHIRFDLDANFRVGMTSVWRVLSRHDSGSLLGTVRWFGSWRKYAFHANSGLVLEEVCMTEISAFLVARTREHRKAKALAAQQPPPASTDNTVAL